MFTILRNNQLRMKLTRDGKGTVFIWVPSMWALEEIQLQTAAKDALNGDIADELIPFFD